MNRKRHVYPVPLPVAAWFWFDFEVMAMVNEKNRMIKKLDPWNEKRIRRLYTLHSERFSPSQMVPMFGGQLTRAQIVEQHAKLGLTLNPEPRFARARAEMEARV